MKAMQAIFFHFMNSEFIYESNVSDLIWNNMNLVDKATFPFDIKMVNWRPCFQCFEYGIRRYFLREDCLSPVHDSGY